MSRRKKIVANIASKLQQPTVCHVSERKKTTRTSYISGWIVSRERERKRGYLFTSVATIRETNTCKHYSACYLLKDRYDAMDKQDEKLIVYHTI